MKKLKVLISAILIFSIVLSFGNVFATTTTSSLGEGYYGYKLDSGTSSSVSGDGTLTVTQNADKIYDYVDTNNLLENAGFEDSTDITAFTGDGYEKELTNCWTINYIKNKDDFSFEVINDSHSGKNALKIDVVSENDLRLHSLTNMATFTPSTVNKTDAEGRTTNLTVDTEYIISYWVKGDASTKVWARAINASNSSFGSSVSVESIDNPADDWKLSTATLKANSNGELWWCVFVNKNNETNTTAIVDDIQLVTVEQARANVVSMIENLVITSPTAERAIDDIKQWAAVLGSDKISNYADFETKKAAFERLNTYDYVAEGNIFDNSSFELSDTALNSTVKNGDYSEITTGWIDNQVTPSSRALITMDTDDAHSGKNSLAIKTISGQPRLVSSAFEVSDWTIVVDKDKKYTISYWAKGDEFVRVMYWTGTSGNWGTQGWSATSSTAVEPGSDWKLFTYEFDSSKMATYTSGDVSKDVIRLAIHFNGSSSNTIHIDDVVLTTTDQTIANVEKMIENLDISSPNATRAIDDIEQWITALGSENISNYDLFQMKKSGYVYYNDSTYLENTGFEKSDVVTAINGGGNDKEITTGWTTNYGNSNVVFGISNDSHSGYNALSVNVTSGKDGRLHSSKNYIYTSNVEGDEGYNNSDADFRTGDLETNTEYILSYWVKGTGQTYVWGRTVDNEGKYSGEYRGEYIVDPGENWKLGTNKLTTSENGEFWWNIFVNNPDADGVDTVTAIIDDIQVLTVEENIAFVDSLIDQFAKLDKLNANYARAKADIEAWLPVLNDADLYLKYDTVLNQKYNIITPNTGYTGLAQGYYVASVSLKGEGSVNRVYGTDILDIEKISTALTSDFATYTKPVTVGADGTYYIGVQLTETNNVNVTEIKDFSLKQLENGDANFDETVDIRDIVRLRAYLAKEEVEICEGTANANAADELNEKDIEAIRNIILAIAG